LVKTIKRIIKQRAFLSFLFLKKWLIFMSDFNDNSLGHNGLTTAVLQPEPTLYAETIFHIGKMPVTNSLINSWLVVLVVIIVILFIKNRIKMVPKGAQNFIEIIIESLFNIFDSVTASREKTMKFFPIIFSFFIFILLSNWSGLIPGVGSVGLVIAENGKKIFVPYFRGGTADLNTTLALAVIGVIISHIFSIFTVGAYRYLNKFINIKALLEIPKKILKDPTILLVNPIKFFAGLLEIIGEMAKLASLSFRLFGNIFAGEVLLASMSAILLFGLPIPFMFLEILVGFIQALIFSMLVLTYIIMMTSAEEH